MGEDIAKRLADWIFSKLVRDVPQELAVCEFGCREPYCTYGKWETCEKREDPKTASRTAES
jgi:hypothetical protein